MYIRKLFFLCCLFFPFTLHWSCKKDVDTIPNVYVDLYIYTTDPGFISLNAVGGWTYITGGVKGIVIYRKSVTEFMAYERNCTYEPSNSCARIEVDVSSNLIAVDSCCSSQFIITDGSVIKGPATLPLKNYQTAFDGTVLHIYN